MSYTALFYAVNGLGLGHLTRCLAVARQMRRLDAACQPLFITSSEACHVLYREGIPYYHLPSKNLAARAGITRSQLMQMYQLTVQNVVAVHRPAVFVVDSFPIGSLYDLFNVLTLPTGMRRVFIHREQRREAMDETRVRQQNLYHLIIAPHEEGAAEIPVTPLGSEAARVFWSGPILVRSRDEILSREEARRIIGAPADKKLVYVSLGGGGDEQAQAAFELIEAAVLEFPDVHLVVARGPLAQAIPPSRERVSYIDWYPMMELFAAFDAAISAAGYNAFHELLYCGVPTVFLPQERGYDDQHRRARAARERGAAETVEELSPGSLQRALSHVLDASVACGMRQRAQQIVGVNGAENAARAILELASSG